MYWTPPTRPNNVLLLIWKNRRCLCSLKKITNILIRQSIYQFDIWIDQKISLADFNLLKPKGYPTPTPDIFIKTKDKEERGNSLSSSHDTPKFFTDADFHFYYIYGSTRYTSNALSSLSPHTALDNVSHVPMITRSFLPAIRVIRPQARSRIFLLNREKRATDCFTEPACENDKSSCLVSFYLYSST